MPRKCQHPNCTKYSCFNLPTETKGIYCFEHKKEKMVDVKSRKCRYPNCTKQPTFNLPTETRGLFCFEHKKENMVNVTSKRICQRPNCTKIPTFNLPTETRGIYCSEHKKENMINVTIKKCQYPNCTKIPTFNLPTETRGLFCFEHKKENMINVTIKKCQYSNCTKIPTFNLPIETRGIYCLEHKKRNMVSMQRNKCRHNGCSLVALFASKDSKKPLYCQAHKKKGMVNLMVFKKCSVDNCQNEYQFEVKNKKYCLEHCPDRKVHAVVKRLCKYCDMEFEHSDFVCSECRQNSHKKEWGVVRYLRQNIDTKFEHDSSKILGECSKKRPDCFFDLDKHCVIVEIDENQHKSYNDSCECSRVNEIVNSVGGRSITLIRYNPDTIKNKNKTLKIDSKRRLRTLKKIVKKELTREPNKFEVKLVQLYYNDDYKEYKPVKREDITSQVAI